MSPQGSVTPEQLVAILEASGFYREHVDSPWFMNSDRKRARGPGAIQVDLGTATSLPLGVVRRYLIERGMHPGHLDVAIAAVLGGQ